MSELSLHQDRQCGRVYRARMAINGRLIAHFIIRSGSYGSAGKAGKAGRGGAWQGKAWQAGLGVAWQG